MENDVRAHSPRGTVLLNLALMLGATILVVLLVEPLLRLRYPAPVTPRMVLEVQPYLRAHPVLGFTWEHDISSERGILFHYGDIEFEPLSTDEFGVINAPDAIAQRRARKPVEVLGLGDSFMEMAAAEFYRAFAACHVGYYSLAIHRHAPPHYAALFADPGIAMKPKVAVLGLFENDFAETEDYLTWRTSAYRGSTITRARGTGRRCLSTSCSASCMRGSAATKPWRTGCACGCAGSA